MPPGKRRRGERGSSSDETRTRVLAAARDLAVEEGFDAFTVERVAERAGVSRMTVYYQFGARHELLEELFDYVATRGRIDRLPDALKRPDPLDALVDFIAVFCGMWASDRIGIRRLRSWSGLRPDETRVGVHERDAWRRQALEVVVARIRKRYGVPAAGALQETIDVLHTLTSFESYDNLARGDRDEHEVAALLYRSARSVLGVEGR